MSIDFEQYLTIRGEIRNRLEQRGIGNEDPTALFNAALETKKQYQKSWDELSERGEPKPKSPEYSQAKRVVSSFGPLLNRVNEEKAALVNSIIDKYNLNPELDPRAIIVCGALFESDMFCPLDQNPDSELIAEIVERTVESDGKISLLMFSCPEIDASFLASGYPDLFIKTSAGTNTGTAGSREVRKLLNRVSLSDFPCKLNIVVGELDEESYLFPVIGDCGTNPEALVDRRARYLEDFKSQCEKKYAGFTVNVYGWSQFDNSQIVEENLPSFWYLADEAKRIANFFVPGGYYDGLPCPDDDQLLGIARLKTQTYALQGYILKQQFSSAIGLQNEYPADLRTLMVNSMLLAKGEERIPMIYPFDSGKSLY